MAEYPDKVRIIKEDYESSYKCLNIYRPIKQETLEYHFRNIFQRLEGIRVLFNAHYSRLTVGPKTAADAFLIDLITRTNKLATRKSITIELPNSIHENTPYNIVIQSPEAKMSQTVVEFLNTASRQVINFDGRSEKLRSFLDSLQLVDLIKGEHEAEAVSLIKTKLVGNARNLIDKEDKVVDIINKLNNTVKGESVEVSTAKMMNLKQ